MNKTPINLQIGIENMTRCPGSCQGCLMTAEERKTGRLWSPDVLKCAATWIKGYLDHWFINQSQDTIESVSLFLGPGDHLELVDDEIRQLIDFIVAATDNRATAIVTMSAIGKFEIIKRKIDLFYDLSVHYGLSLFPQFVFDPLKSMRNLFKISYAENITYCRTKFGSVELTINLGPDVIEKISPKQLHQILVENDFRQIELNILPTNQSDQIFKPIWIKLIDWVIEFYNRWDLDQNYELNFAPVLYEIMQLVQGQNLTQQIRSHIKESLWHNLYIENNGHIFYAQHGVVGNLVPLSSRFNRLPVGHIEETVDKGLNDYFHKAEPMANKMLARYMRSVHCHHCEFRNTCLMTGCFSFINLNFIKNEDADCPLMIKPLFAAIENRQQEMQSYQGLFSRNYAQHSSIVERSSGHFLMPPESDAHVKFK